jgi:hypothetical protein
MSSVCAIQDECKVRFFEGEQTEDTQFARDLLLHLQNLHENGHLTADFLRLAFRALGKSVALDSGFRQLVDEAATCLAERGESA